MMPLRRGHRPAQLTTQSKYGGRLRLVRGLALFDCSRSGDRGQWRLGSGSTPNTPRLLTPSGAFHFYHTPAAVVERTKGKCPAVLAVNAAPRRRVSSTAVLAFKAESIADLSFESS